MVRAVLAEVKSIIVSAAAEKQDTAASAENLLLLNPPSPSLPRKAVHPEMSNPKA